MKCFLDRDGIINKDTNYVGTWERFEWCPYIKECMKLLRCKGYQLILVTNQSGLARGYYSYSDFLGLTFNMLKELEAENLYLEINFCPHKPEDHCKCRKPKPGMLKRYEISKKDIIIGDNETDMQAGINAEIENRWIVGRAAKVSQASTRKFISHKELYEFLVAYNP